MELVLDLGSELDMERLEAHLAERGLTLEDVLTVAEWAVPRKKGDRMYAYGRGLGGRLVVVVLAERGGSWRPRTAWQMDATEERWWRKQGGR